MSDHRPVPPEAGTSPLEHGPGAERIPLPQRLMDDVTLLLIAGLVVPTVLFIAWGLMSISRVPDFAR